MIINTAIVEDDDGDAESLASMLKKYSESGKAEFRVSRFRDAISFLEGYVSFDLVFMDIELPDYDGMKASKKLREKDKSVMIIFVTNMAQYAVESYEVQAYDFILKPLSYGNFFMKFRRVLKRLSHRAYDAYLTLSSRFEQRRVRISDIVYVEVNRHNLIFHLSGDEEMHMTGTMADWESRLAPYHFVRCNTYLLVNLGYVTRIYGDEVTVGGKILRVSRSKKQQLMNEFAKYMGGSK